ncbi:MAG TPA: Crp/Fnr family transcriptional regulator [Pirellulales bacterium]|jgi:CRP/FNR family cyclic AMP-dependent transcriptional regulator|nr:Crp/Fnr family transcriptional regulator [Pirellulales bacterium]
MAERLWHLKHCGLFERLDAKEMAELESRSRAKLFPPKAFIYSPRDDADSVLLLADGRARLVSLNDDGKQTILAFLEAGDLFGELAVAGVDSREEYAETVAASTVVQMPREALEDLMSRHAPLSLAITRLIGMRRRRIERRLQHLLFRSSRDRLVHLLLELADDYGQPSPDGTRIGLKVSHQDLADVIGTTRESVTLRLGELQREGLVKVVRRTIVVTDRTCLADSLTLPPPSGNGRGANVSKLTDLPHPNG